MFILAYSPVALQRLLGKPAIDKTDQKLLCFSKLLCLMFRVLPRLTPDGTGMVKLNHEDIQLCVRRKRQNTKSLLQARR